MVAKLTAFVKRPVKKTPRRNGSFGVGWGSFDGSMAGRRGRDRFEVGNCLRLKRDPREVAAVRVENDLQFLTGEAGRNQFRDYLLDEFLAIGGPDRQRAFRQGEEDAPTVHGVDPAQLPTVEGGVELEEASECRSQSVEVDDGAQS